MTFTVRRRGRPNRYAVTPVLTARVGIAAVGDDPVHAIALRCQVRIEPLRRGYSDEEAAGLLDLFGPRERWATTQHTFLWQHSTAMVQGFTGATEVTSRWSAPTTSRSPPRSICTRCATARCRCNSCSAERFSSKGPRGFAVQQVPWDREDRYDMPVSVWRDLIALHYPEHRLGAAEPRHHRRAGGLQVGARTARPRRRGHLAAGRPAPPRRSDDRGLGPGPRRRRRGALRGLSALSVSRHSQQEPDRAGSSGCSGPPGAADGGHRRGRHHCPRSSWSTPAETPRSRSWCASCSCSTAASNEMSATAASNRSTNSPRGSHPG